MNTSEIIKELNSISITSQNEDEIIERIDQLTGELSELADGYLACEAMINLLERHPQTDFGAPGAIIHTIEDYTGHYEKFLFESLKRQPTERTLMLLHRIINSEKNPEEINRLLKIFKKCARHPLADKSVKYSIKEYLNYRKEKLRPEL